MSSSGGQVALATGDIEIGAVEIKDQDTDTRADVAADAATLAATFNALGVHAFGRMFDGANWQRIRSSDGDASTLPTLLGVQPMLRNNTDALAYLPRQARTNGANLAQGVTAIVPHMWDGVSGFSILQLPGDARSNDNIMATAPSYFNGVTWDRQRNNAEITVLASASNAAGTRTSADQTNFNARGVLLMLDITALGAAETLTLIVDAKDPVSGIYIGLTAFVDVGVDTAYTLYPGAVETAAVVALQVQGVALPRTWRVRVTTAPAVNASTYSVGASYIL